MSKCSSTEKTVKTIAHCRQNFTILHGLFQTCKTVFHADINSILMEESGFERIKAQLKASHDKIDPFLFFNNVSST
jgi:hypothetical protein